MAPADPSRPSSLPSLMGGLFVIVSGLFVWWLFEGFLPPPEPQLARVEEAPPAVPGEDAPVLLVLPLEAVESGEAPGTATGVHSGLVGSLSRASGWRIITGEASVPPGARGARGGTGVEGVDAVLAGDLIQDGDGLVLTLRLTAAPSGDPLWSGTYEGRVASARELALTASGSLARELQLYRELLPPGGSGSPP
jgi:TolB-like protein